MFLKPLGVTMTGSTRGRPRRSARALLALEGQREPAVPAQPRLLLVAARRLPAAKRRGMDLVTITDHDSHRRLAGAAGRASGCQRHPHRRGSLVPSARTATSQVHLGVYGITEALHAEIQPLRRERVRRDRPAARAERVLRAEPPAALLPRTGAARIVPAAALGGAGARSPERRDARRRTIVLVERLSREWRGAAPPLACVAGSDAHTLAADRPHMDRGAGHDRGRVPGVACGGPGHARRAAWRRAAVAGTPTASLRATARASTAADRAITTAGTAPSARSASRPRCRCSSCRGRGGGREIARTTRSARPPLETLAAWPRSVRVVGAATRRRKAMSAPRVAITGIGMVTALGATREENWTNLLNGDVRHAATSPLFPTEGFRSRSPRRCRPRSPPAALHAAAAAPVVAERSVRRWSPPGKRSTTAALTRRPRPDRASASSSAPALPICCAPSGISRR